MSAPVTPGKTYYISGININASFPLVVMFNSNDAVIGTVATNNDGEIVTDRVFVPVENCVRVSINSRRGSPRVYPVIYSIEKTDESMNDVINKLNDSQTKSIEWLQVNANVVKDQHILIDNYKATISSNYAGGYSYIKIPYDKTKHYRFYGRCPEEIMPFVLFCDSNDEIISVFNTVGYYEKKVLTIPENTEFIYVNGYAKLIAMAEIATEKSLESFESNKVGVFFGDSITQGLNVTVSSAISFKDYPSIVGNILHAHTYNGGLGGSTYSAERTIDLKNVVDCIISGNFTTIYNGITQYGLDASAKLQYDAISTLNFNDVDFVVFSEGTNDWNFNKTVEQIKTAMIYCISTLLTAYPHLKLYVLTPIYRSNINSSGQDSDTYVNETTGLKLTDVCDTIIATAKEYHVPCKNMYDESGMNSYTKSLYFPSDDGTHPNATGYSLMGEKIAKFINAN